MSRLLVICMLSIALASLVTSDTIANSTIVCQGSACQQEKAGSGTGTAETSKRMRRHATAAGTNSLKELVEMAPSSVAGDSQSARWNTEDGGGREKRWTRCARGSYFHPELGKCIQKENYYADGTYGESSIRDARPSRTKPQIRHRRRWRSNSGGITGNRHWFWDEPKGIMESPSFQRPYRTPQYLERQAVGVPFHQTEEHGSVADSRERWGEDASRPRLYRGPRDFRRERGFWSKLFHIHSSSNNETTKHEATIGPYIQAPLSKQSALNTGEADKPRTMQSSQDRESTGTDTLSDADPLLSKLEKELSANATESKDLSPRPVVMKVTYESKGIESPEWNNVHSKVSDNSVKKLSATKDLLNEEGHKTAGDKHKTIISGTDIENAESKDSLTIKDLAEKTPEIQNLVPPVISLNETFASNSVDYSASNNDGTDYSQQKLPGEEMAASKDFMRNQVQKPVGERYQTLMENTSTGDLWATNNLGGKVVEFQNSDPSYFAQNETFEVKRAKSPASASDHSEVTGYSSRIVAGTVNGVSKDFLEKQRSLPVGSRYKMIMRDPDTRSSITKSLLDRKDVVDQVDSTSNHRFMNEAEKESEITVNNSKYEELPALYSSIVKITPDIIPKLEQKRRRDVMSQNLRTKFSDEAQEVGQMPVFISNADFTGEASEVLPLREKIHRIYELARKPVYNSQWSSDGASNNEAVAQSFNNEQQGFHWWHTAASDDSAIRNQQSLRPDESNSATHDSAELFPFYTAMDSNKAVEMEKKKSRGEDLHHENTIAGKLISGLIKRPGEPISASGLNGPTAEQAISRTHEGPMTPTYEDSYSEIIPVDYGPQDFDLGSSSIDEPDSENNKDTLEYPLPNNAGGNQWRQQIFHGHDMPYVQDLGETDSQTIQDDPRWSPGVGVSRLISRDQQFLSPQSVLVFQQPDSNQNSFRNSPQASIPGSVPLGRFFPLSPSISLDQADHHPFHFSPTGSRHPVFGAAYPQNGGKHTEDSSRGFTHLQSMRSVSHAANSSQFPTGRELGQGSYKVDQVNDFKKRNLPDGNTRPHSTADIDIARKLRVQRALRKFDTTGLLQSNIPLILPQPLQMNRDPFSNNPTGDVFQQSLPEANVYNADASQYTGHQPQNYLPQEQLLNMLAESGNQYSETSNTADRGNLEFVPHNYPETHESLPNSQFIPNSAQFETAMFQYPEIKFSNVPQTWFQSQKTYGSFEGYQVPPSAVAKTQGEKVSAQTAEVNHESVNDGEFPEPEKVPPQNYIPIYNYTLAEQKNVQIPIPNSNDSTYASYDLDFPSRGMEGTHVSASLEPSVQYEYPKTMEVANVQAPLYPFSEKADNQRVSEASAQSSFSMSNESSLEAVPEMPMNGNSEVHDVLISTKSPENLPHMSFVGHLAEQPSDLPVNGLPSVSSEKQSQRQQLESLLSQHVPQTRVESNIQQPSLHSDNSFNPPIKKSSSEPGKLQQFGTMLANELKSLHIHQPTLPQKEESQLYSNTDSDTARAAYQKWLNERINMQARVLQALQPRSAPGQVTPQSGLTGPSQLSKEDGSPAAINNVETKMVPVQGNANFPAVLKISVDIPSYTKMRKWESSIQERSGVVHPSQDELIPGNRITDSSNTAKILHKKEYDRTGVNELNNVESIKANVQSPQMRVQNSQQDSAQDLSLIAPDRIQQEQRVAPIYDIRKSSFQAYIPQSVATATWANKMAVIRSICNDHKNYGHSSSNPLRLPRDKRQVVIHDDFLRDILKMMNIGERYLFPSSVTTGVKQINTTVKETDDNNQLRQLSGIETKDTTSSKDGTEPVVVGKEIRITVDKIKDLCEIIRDNPSLLDSVLSKIYPEEAPQLKLESAVYQDPSIISSEQVENQSPNFPNEHILYTNSAGFHYSNEPHDGSHMEHVHETAGSPHMDHIHEEGVESHTNHIHYPHEGPHTGYSHNIGQDSHTDQWHDEDRGSNTDHYHHYTDEASHTGHYHNAGEASHTDHYHNAGEATHPDHWPNVDNGHHPDHWPTEDNGHHPDHWPTADNGHHPNHWPTADNGHHPDHWPNEDHGPHSDHWPNEDLSPHLDHWHNPVIVHHPDHWPNVEQSPHPDHWHNGEESSHMDHSYHAGEEHYPDHLYDTYDNSHYDTDENAQVFETHEELGSEDFLEAPELLPTDTAEGHPLNHVSSMVETSIDTVRCDDHVVHKLTIQIPADMWKLLQEGSGAHSGEPIVTIQIEVPVFDHNDSNFEDFPENALVNTKRNTPEKRKEFQFRITPNFDEADVTKLENERKACDSHYSSEDDVSSLHQRTVSEFLHSLPGMQRTPSFHGPESNATVLQFVPGVYPEGIGQTKRQENSYFTNKERTRLTPGATHSSGNVAVLHNNIARLTTESKTRLSKNDPRLLSFRIYHSQPGGLRILPEGGGTVPLRVVGPNGEVLYDTNKECQRVPARTFPVSLAPALITEANNTVQDRSACNNSSCEQLTGTSMYSNGVPRSSPNVQLTSFNDLVRFFQSPDQPSVGKDRNLKIGTGARYKLDNKLGNTRNTRSSVSKKEKKTEMTDKILTKRRHSLSKHVLRGLPRRSPDKFMVVDHKIYDADDEKISKRSSKTHRYTDEAGFGDEKVKDISSRFPYDPAVATMKQTLKPNDAPVLGKDKRESNHFKVLTSDGESIAAKFYEAQKYKRRLLWLEDNDDNEETVLPKVYARNPLQLVMGSLSEQAGIVDEQHDVKTNPLYYSPQFPGRYSDIRRPVDSYNAIQRSTKRSYNLHHDGSSYVTGLGRSRRQKTKDGETFEGSIDRFSSPHQQKRKSGLSHYFLKSQLARNHLLPNVRNGKYEPASLQPNTGKHRQRRFLKNWRRRQSPQVRQSTYWSNNNIHKFNYPNVQFIDDGHFGPKRGSELPNKNISSGGDQSVSTDNTTVNPTLQAQNSDVNNSSIVDNPLSMQSTETQQNGSAQSLNASVPEHSEMSSTELNVNTSGNHSSEQSLPTTTEICTTVEEHLRGGAATNEGPSKSSGGDKVDASLDLKLKLQYDKNKDALEGEIQDFHLTPKGNESHANNVMQNHSNELQHSASIRSYNTLSYFRRGTVFPAQSVKERLALFEYSVKHGGKSHTFHGMPNSYKRNFDFKEVPKNDLPPSNYKSIHNFPFRQKDEALADAMFHQVSRSNQYPYENSNSQNTVIHHYPHISYYSTNKNIDDVVNGQLSPADVLQSQSNLETLSHSVPEKWNVGNSKSASSQMKQVENYAEDKLPDSEIISTNITNKLNYERSDWMHRSPSYSSYVPEENNFESLVGEMSGGLHDSYSITTSLARYTDDKHESLQQGTLENRKSDVESKAFNQENNPARVSRQKSQYPFTDTSNKNKQNVATNIPVYLPVARNRLNEAVSPEDVAGIGAGLESLDADWKNHVDLDSIDVVRSFQHGRKILHANEDEGDDDGDVDPANDNLLFEYDKLKDIQTKRKVNKKDAKFHVNPTSDSKRSFQFRNQDKAQRTPKRQHPKFKDRSMPKSQHSSSVKKTGTHEKKSVNSDPVYLTTYLETKQSAHPHDIQIKKHKEIKNDVLKSMHRRALSSAEGFSMNDNNLYQPHKSRDYGYDQSSRKHTLPNSTVKLRRGHTYKKQQLSYNHKIVNPSHSYKKNSKSLLRHREGTKIKVKKERGKKNKTRKKNLHSKKHTNIFHIKHSKHKHSPPKRHYLFHTNQRQYRSKNTITELEAGNILHKQRHHTRKKRSTNERETSNHEEPRLAKSYYEQSEVKNYESTLTPGNKHSLHEYESYSARAPYEMKSENIVKSVDLENNFLGINLKSPVTLSHASVSNETHYLKKMNLETLGKSRPVKYPRSSKLNYMYNLQEDVTPEKNIKLGNLKLTEEMKYYPRTRHCSENFHLLSCSQPEDSDGFYQHALNPNKFDQRALSAEILDKREQSQQKGSTMTQNKKLSTAGFLPSVSQEVPQKGISELTIEESPASMHYLLPYQDSFTIGSHLKPDQPEPLSGEHIDVDSSINRNTHNAQHFNSMNISENIIPAIKFTGLADSGTKNRISELQNMYRHKHLQYANQPKHLSYINMQESKPVLLSDSMHSFGKGIVGTTENLTNLADKRMKYGFDARTKSFTNEKLPQKLFLSRSKEKFHISDKINVKSRLRGDTRKSMTFYVDKNPKIQSNKHMKVIKLTKSKSIQQNEDVNRVQEDNSLPAKKDSLFDKALTSKKGIANVNKLASNYGFNVYNQQLNNRSSGKKVAVNLQSAVNQARVTKIDLPRNIKIRADQTEILTGNDDDTALVDTETDIVVTTISDIVSDDAEEDEYEMIVTTEQVIPKTDAKKQWNFEPEDVTEATDYIEEENTNTEVSALQPTSFPETVPSATKVDDWPEVEDVMEATDSVEEQSNDIEISTFGSLQSESITEFVPRVIQVENGSEMEITDDEIVTISQITTGAGTVSALGHIKEGLTTEAAVLTKSQVETEIPYENLRTANTELYNSSVVSNSESQAAVNVEIETTEMQIENEGEHKNENTTVLTIKGSPGKVTPTSTFISTKKNTMKITSEITVTAKIMIDENEATEKVPEEEDTDITNKNTFTSISDKEYEESTENVSAESMPTEIYNTEGNFKPETEKEGEEEGKVEVEGTEETTGYEESERYSESMPLAATVAVSSISAEYEDSEKIETVTTESETESDTEITQVLEEYPQKSDLEGAEEEPVEEETSELRQTTEESAEGITGTISEEVGGDEEEEVGEEAEGVEVGKEESTEEIIGTLAPVSEEEGEELGEEAGGEEGVEVGEEESTARIIGTLVPIAEEEGGEETEGEEFEEEGGEEVGEEETTEDTLAPIPEEEIGEEEIGGEAGGEDLDEEGGGEVGEEETTEEIVGTLFPAAKEEGEEVGKEEVDEEAEGGEELGEEDTAEGITGTLTTSEDKGELGGEKDEEIGGSGEEDEEIGGSGEEEGDVVPLGGGEEEEEEGEEEEEEEMGGEEVGDDEEGKEELETEATSVETAGKMLTENGSSTNRVESVTVEEGVTTEGKGRTESKGMTEEGRTEEESTTEEAEAVQEEEIAEEEETTEAKATSGMLATTEEGEMIGEEETTALEETTEERETTIVAKTTEEEGTTEREGTTETEDTLKEEEVYAEYLAPQETAQGVDMTSHKTVQAGETTLAGKWEECSVNQSSCICSLDDMLHELSATWKGSSVLEAASHYDRTCPKSRGKIGKFRITNDMEPVVPHQKERDKNTVRLMKNITAIGIMSALAVSNTAISGQETLIFPGSHIIIPCANTTEMFQVDDRGISYHWLSPSGTELTGGHTELIEDGKYLRLSGVVPRDDGTYRCETPSSDNRTASPSYIHRIRVVQLPQVVQQVTVRYKITPHCGEDMTQLLQLFLAPAVRRAVCGQLCSISIPKASCSIGEDGRPQMMVIFLSRLGHAHLLLPGHEQSECNVPCSARVDAIFARNAAQNLPRVLTSKGFRTAPLTSPPCPATWLCHF